MGDAPVIAVESREELVSLLCEAAELEHGLACSYLFTAFSLKRDEAAGLTLDQVEAVTRWRKTIKDVAEEEMLHLALVANLLTALGAAPHLRRPPFPQTSRYYPAGITIDLARFDEATLTRFIFLERPEDIDVEDEIASDESVDLDALVPSLAPGALVSVDEAIEGANAASQPERYSTVGHLYSVIERAFCDLVDRCGEEDVFVGPPRAQATTSHFDLPELAAVTDLASARRAIEVLTTQGEGVRGDWNDAHYGRFLQVRSELRKQRELDPGFDPAWPVLRNPVAEEPSDANVERTVDDPTSRTVMQLFDGCYVVMTAMLLRCFAHTDEAEGALRDLARASVDLMEDVLAPLGGLLATMPAGPSHPDATAGAGFELYRPVDLLPHRRAAWLILHERLLELASQANRLADDDGGPQVLGAVADALTRVATQLRPHLERDPLVGPE